MKKQRSNTKLVNNDKPAKRNSHQGKSTDAEQCNEPPKLRQRRSRQSVDPDGEIETFRGNGTNETEDQSTSSLALDLSHEKICESNLEDENDAATDSENLRNFNENVSSLSNQVERDNTENTVTWCETEENKGCDCIDAICDFGPIELPRTGSDSVNSTDEKRLSIGSVDANCEASNIKNSRSMTVSQSSAQSKHRRLEVNSGIVDDGITTIDNIVITRKQSEDIRQWIQGEKNESDSNSEDGEISFKCSPVKQTETPVKTLNFHCDCGHDFARRSSLTIHRRSSKCPLSGGKPEGLAGTSSDEAVTSGKVSFEVDSEKTSSRAEELEHSKGKIMPRPRRASLPVTTHSGGVQNGLPLKEMVPPQNKTLKGRRSVGASKHEKGKTQDTESHSVTPEDAQMSIADMLDSLMSTDENTMKSKKRTRSVSDVENDSDTASKKSRMNVAVVSQPSEERMTEDGSKKENKRERRKSQRKDQKNLESNDVPSGTNVDTDNNVSKEDKHDASTLNTVSSPSANAGKVVKRRGRPPSKKIPSDEVSVIDQTDGSSDLPENPVVNKPTSASNGEGPATGAIQPSGAGPVPKRKRGRPPKSAAVVTNTKATAETTTKQESTDDSFDISPNTTSKSHKVIKVPKRRRTEQLVKKSLARAKANLSNRDSKPEGQIKRVVKCSCGGLYSQVGSVRRHQLNTKCPLGKYQYVYVEKVEKPVKERKYICSCGKAFTQSSSMQRHQKNSACPFISAGVFNPSSARPGRRRKSSLAVSSSVDGARDNLEGQSTDTSEVSEPVGPQKSKSATTSGSPKIISKTDATAASATEDSRAKLDEEPELGKRVDYSLATSYICSCNQTFKFYGSIRRHQKHTKCSSMRKCVKGQDAEASSTQEKEQKDTRHPSDQETTEKDRNLNEDSNEEVSIKKEPDSSEYFEGTQSPFTKKRRISAGTKKRQSTSSTKEKGNSSSSGNNNRSIDKKTSDNDISNDSLFDDDDGGGGDERRKRKRKKRLKESGELVAYFPCPCGKKYKHKRDLYTHQKRSATCPIIARLTKPVLFKISTFKSRRGQSKSDDSDSSSSEEESNDDKTSESSEESFVENESEEEPNVMSQTVEVKKPKITSPKKNTPRPKQNAARISKTSQESPEILSKKVCTADKTPKSGSKITEAEPGTSDQQADVKKAENSDIAQAEHTATKKCTTPPDVNTCIRCKCGSTFTRVFSLKRHWRRNCKIVSESEKNQIIEKIRKTLRDKRAMMRQKESKVVSKKIKTKAQTLVMKARNLAVKNANKKLVVARTAKKIQMKKAQKIKRRGRRNFMGGFANPSDPPGCYPCPCGKKYKYRRDLQTHQRKSETCPKTAWISEKKIQEYGQAPGCLKKSVALIRKWQARRPSVSPSRTAKQARMSEEVCGIDTEMASEKAKC